MFFSSIKLIGFKSFADQTTLDIYPGLNGVIGPNGTGKSNIIEALKWAMGETAAKSLRASGMDDVIFSGTSTRSSRNIAKVSITLDNSEKKLPEKYNKDSIIEIERQITRDSGSKYKINGKEVRAKEIHFLLADASSGARSSSIINQGQVGEIINLKPNERRRLLEDAAGISGIHVRRHEAEVKMNATKNNLARLSDIMMEFNSRLTALQKQERQAKRYKTIAHRIKKTESSLALSRWNNAIKNHTDAQKTLEDVSSKMNTSQKEFHDKELKYNNALKIFQDLSNDKIEIDKLFTNTKSELDKVKFKLLSIDNEIKTKAALSEQIQINIEREKASLIQLEESLKILNIEKKEPLEKNKNHTLVKLESAIEDKRKEINNLSKNIDKIKLETSAIVARKERHDYELQNIEDNIIKITKQIDNVKIEENIIKENSDSVANISLALNNQNISQKKLHLTNEQLFKTKLEQDELSSKYIDLQSNNSKMSSVLISQNSELSSLDSKLSILKSIDTNYKNNTIWNSLKIKKEYELAFLTAIGDAIEASESPTGNMTWLVLENENINKLPDELIKLGDFVKAPKALHKFLSQIGVVSDEKKGALLQKRLSQGQIIVTTDGSLWRWDGFHIKASNQNTAYKRLNSKTKRISLEKNLMLVKDKIEQTHKEISQNQKNLQSYQEKISSNNKTIILLSNEVDAYTKKYEIEKNIYTKLKSNSMENSSKLASLSDKEKDLNKQKSFYKTSLKNFLNSNNNNTNYEKLEKSLLGYLDDEKEKKNILESLIIEHATLRQSIERKEQNYNKLESEIKRLLNEIVHSKKNKEVSLLQLNTINNELLNLKNTPSNMKLDEAKFKEELKNIENKKAMVSEKIDHITTKNLTLKESLNNNQSNLSNIRDESIRKESLVSQCKNIIDIEKKRIKEQLNVEPNQLTKLAEIAENETLHTIEKIESSLKRLYNERESMGGVNLQAENEVLELSKKIDSINKEEEDLNDSITQLRKAILELNSEARARMKKAFNEVNENFSSLFKKLFGGGDAHMKLIDSEDPLQAGLELMASPPGKKLQKLSLLSGGEKALTALALIFSVFLKKTMPICVLDEVDAPLDESNVTRFSNLITHISKLTKTRFLVITHNKLTMGHMDKLYGVTMVEPGVSKLVSVNLESAEKFYNN